MKDYTPYTVKKLHRQEKEAPVGMPDKKPIFFRANKGRPRPPKPKPKPPYNGAA